MLIAAKNSVLHNISSLLICYVRTGSTIPTLVLKCLFFVIFLNNNYFNYNMVLDLSSYFYFQKISTPVEEDNEDDDDEGTLRAKREKSSGRWGRSKATRSSLLPVTPYADEGGIASKAAKEELPPGRLWR